MAEIFSGLASMPCSETMKPSSMPLKYPENTFLGIEVDAICPEFSKGSFKIGDKVVSPFGLNYDVINIGLNSPPDEVPETLAHTMLVCSPSILQTEWCCDVAERSKWGDERCCELVRLFHRDLMVPRVRIKEAKSFAP